MANQPRPALTHPRTTRASAHTVSTSERHKPLDDAGVSRLLAVVDACLGPVTGQGTSPAPRQADREPSRDRRGPLPTLRVEVGAAQRAAGGIWCDPLTAPGAISRMHRGRMRLINLRPLKDTSVGAKNRRETLRLRPAPQPRSAASPDAVLFAEFRRLPGCSRAVASTGPSRTEQLAGRRQGCSMRAIHALDAVT
jgi:hypothetical protein